MIDTTMTNNKPYLIRAMHDWICDNAATPYLYVDTEAENLNLPEHLLAENPLILNASPNACRNLALENDAISFQARFSGQVFDVYLPIDAIIAIVARENGQGMQFEWQSNHDAEDSESDNNSKSTAPQPVDNEAKPKKGGLKIVR